MPHPNPTTDDREESGIHRLSPAVERALRGLTEQELREALASGELVWVLDVTDSALAPARAQR